MNVSLTEPMEQFVREKVAVGDYETASEVVREALRLLRQRDKVWKGELDSKIKAGLNSIRAGRIHLPGQVRKEMTAFKKSWSKNHATK